MTDFKKKIFIACDHAGFEVKNMVASFLKERGFAVFDCGAHFYNIEDDFPDFMHEVGFNVSKQNQKSLGIVFGGSGIGEAALLNRYHNVRCGVFFGSNIEIVKNGRQHDNINAIAIGVRYTTDADIIEAVRVFIDTDFFSENRFVRRISKIENIITNSGSVK